MKSFAFWFLSEIPSFLMSEPIVYFVALAVLLIIISAVIRLMKF